MSFSRRKGHLLLANAGERIAALLEDLKTSLNLAAGKNQDGASDGQDSECLNLRLT
jgi:hypothetical protein